MTTLNTMVKRCEGLLGTSDISEWEETFLASIIRRTQHGDDTSSLTERQITALENIFERNFAA